MTVFIARKSDDRAPCMEIVSSLRIVEAIKELSRDESLLSTISGNELASSQYAVFYRIILAKLCPHIKHDKLYEENERRNNTPEFLVKQYLRIIFHLYFTKNLLST